MEWNNRSLRTGGVCVRKKEHAWCVHGKQGSVCTADESLCLCMPCTAARQHSSLCCCWAGPWLSFVGRQAGTRWIIFCLLLLLLPLPAFIFVAGPSPICQRQQQTQLRAGSPLDSRSSTSSPILLHPSTALEKKRKEHR